MYNVSHRCTASGERGEGGLLSENNKKKCVKNNNSFAVLTKRGGEVFPSPPATAELEGRG